MVEDQPDTFAFSNSHQEQTDKESSVRIDLERIEDADIKIHFPEDSKDSNSNFSENVTSEKNLYDLMGSIKDQIQYQSKFLKHNHHFRSRAQEKSQNPFAFKGNGRILSKDYKIKVKTELCKSFVKNGTCTYGDSCAFAHGEAELQKKKHVPSRYKTKLCQ